MPDLFSSLPWQTILIILLTVVQGVLGGYLTIVGTRTLIERNKQQHIRPRNRPADKQDRKLVKTKKRLTKEGKHFFRVVGLIAILAVIQLILNNDKERSDAIEAKEEKRISDSTTVAAINHGVDSSSKILSKNMADALAKQGLQIDSLTGGIIKLRDSARTVVMNQPVKDPLLMIVQNGMKISKTTSEATWFQFSLLCKNENVFIKNLKIITEVEYEDGTIRNTKPLLMATDVRISQNDDIALEYYITGTKAPKKITVGFLGNCRADLSGRPLKEWKAVYAYTIGGQTHELILKGRDDFFQKYPL